MRSLATLGLALALLASPAIARKPELPPKPTAQLRLDDSPGLVLLEPFRHAAGLPPQSVRRYVRGRYGRWSNAPWWTLRFSLDTTADGDDAPSDDREDARGAVAVPLARPVPWLLVPALPDDEASRFAIAPDVRPWFSAADYESDRPALELAASPNVVPPWLRGLSESLAGALIAETTCGRGGDCSTDASFPAHAFDKLWWALTPKETPIPAWQCREREVTLQRYGREKDSFRLVGCDGSIPPDALDRLSLLARPTGVERPSELLPSVPDEDAAEHGEWLPNIRLVHPRLLWVLDNIARAHPWRPIYLFSGYRPPESRKRSAGSHKSQHWEGRALDITVPGVANADLFKLCRELPDLACGFYPNNKFVHIGVRNRGEGGIIWIDASKPNDPADYVDSWPGVVEQGGMAWGRPARQP